ncbi:MAG: hypothetical protein ACFFD4_36555, partial [Candidatus Odinarchaeota archaeon]
MKSLKNKNLLIAGYILVVYLLSLAIVAGSNNQEQVTFKELGQIETGGTTYRVEVVDNIAYVVNFEFGLKTYDISNPENPVELDTFSCPNSIDPNIRGGHSLAIRNDMAIVGTVPEAHGEEIIAIGRYY